MSTRECLTFADNLTLIVMDVEPGAGVVWLELRDGHGLLKSSILKTGESFAFDERGEGLNLTVTRIYAGGERDLVDLDLESGEILKRSFQELPDDPYQNRDRPGQSGDSSLLNWGLAIVMVLVLAAWVYFVARSKGR